MEEYLGQRYSYFNYERSVQKLYEYFLKLCYAKKNFDAKIKKMKPSNFTE